MSAAPEGHIALELPGARVLFTSRRGGASTGAYASLNLGRATADDPGAVMANHARVTALTGRETVLARQVHGARVERHPEAPAAEGAEADGQATTRTDLAPLVTVADCLPIALAGRGAVAMLHGGWRGLAAGILAAGVSALRELGDDGPLAAAIGPGAGPCCYEVGEEVHAVFAHHGPGVRGPGRNLDLKAVARRELAAAGVRRVEDVDLCTLCGDPDRWFSHRREHGVTGRQGGAVWRS